MQSSDMVDGEEVSVTFIKSDVIENMQSVYEAATEAGVVNGIADEYSAGVVRNVDAKVVSEAEK